MPQRRSTPISPAQRSQVEIRADSKTLRYEVVNLVALAKEYDPRWRHTAPTRNNAYIESLALRFRTLIDFLFGHLDQPNSNGKLDPPRVYDSDVIAIDFHPTWSPCSVRPQWAIDAKQRAGKEIAHITEERRDLNQPGSNKPPAEWKIADIAVELCKVMKDFLRSTPSAHFASGELDLMINAVLQFAPDARGSTSQTTHSGTVVSNPHLSGRTAPH